MFFGAMLFKLYILADPEWWMFEIFSIMQRILKFCSIVGLKN
jgi:hypothetical protein